MSIIIAAAITPALICSTRNTSSLILVASIIKQLVVIVNNLLRCTEPTILRVGPFSGRWRNRSSIQVGSACALGFSKQFTKNTRYGYKLLILKNYYKLKKQLEISKNYDRL